MKKLPNGVNFKIVNAHKDYKIVHHDRLIPVIENEFRNKPMHMLRQRSESDSGDVSISETDYSFSDSDHSVSEDENIDVRPVRNYPVRHRRARQDPDFIPWDALRIS